MRKGGRAYGGARMTPIGKEVILSHFPNIYRRCREEGYDVTRECIPVVPAQHYFMGGIKVDRYSKTSMENLYATGETACNGVHGRNRLASNSLLESLVFAKRAAKRIAETFDDYDMIETDTDLAAYRGCDKDYGKTVLNEMERMRKYHEQHNTENKR